MEKRRAMLNLDQPVIGAGALLIWVVIMIVRHLFRSGSLPGFDDAADMGRELRDTRTTTDDYWVRPEPVANQKFVSPYDAHERWKCGYCGKRNDEHADTCVACGADYEHRVLNTIEEAKRRSRARGKK
jgi:hypothetical protein